MFYSTEKSDKPIKTFAIGMNTDAIDLKYAKQVADYIGSDHTEIIITKDDVISAIEDVIHLLGTYDITTIRASIGMYLLCKAIHEQTDIRVLLTGEISDELFGYKYTDFAPSSEAFQAESVKRLNELPHDILYREKAAFSDAVGHSMVDYIKEYAENFYSDEKFELECTKYSHAKPFTKESLLYREIFEKYYPNNSEMAADFWMPNKDWEGCDVNDPSARVLSNYGESGK